MGKIIVVEMFVISSIVLPLTFIINSSLSNSFKILIYPGLQQVAVNVKNYFVTNFLYFDNNFRLLFDIIYIISNNLTFFIIIISAIGYVLGKKYLPKNWVYLLTFIILYLNYFILINFIQFAFLPSYERSNYTDRLFEISLYFLLPFLLYIAFIVMKKVMYSGIYLKIMLLTFISAMVTISLYASYPRDDNYHVDRGYNVTLHDIDAVNLIHERAKDDYIVLASPVTAAAAIRQYGFLRYYPQADNAKIQHFYYSIPTGGPLHQYFTQMVSDNTSREIMEKAMDFLQVPQAYFVINKYWWQSEIIIEKAKKDANKWFEINNGQVYVFEYDK